MNTDVTKIESIEKSILKINNLIEEVDKIRSLLIQTKNDLIKLSKEKYDIQCK